MKSIALLLLVAACSNASDPDDTPSQPDARITAPDAAPRTDARTIDAAPTTPALLVINEVAASESPDWFEVVNVSNLSLQLSDFVYCDVANDFTKAKAFPAMTLAPGAYYAQDVDDATSGFKLGGDEELHVYLAADQSLVDEVDWAEGESPTGSSYARAPDRTGDFATTTTPSKGAANP